MKLTPQEQIESLPTKPMPIITPEWDGESIDIMSKLGQIQSGGEKEMVVAPSHYQARVRGNYIECVDVIDALNLNYRLGSCLKYLWRAGRKFEEKIIEDLEKAAYYIEMEVARLKGTSIEQYRIDKANKVLWGTSSPKEKSNVT